MAYATYVAALAPSCLQDNQQDAPLFAFLEEDSGVDGNEDELSSFNQYFEIQSLDLESALILMGCLLPSGLVRPLTFFQIDLPLSDHYHEDETLPFKSQHPLLLNQFQAIDFETPWKPFYHSN